MRTMVFDKHLSAWPVEERARRIRAAGFDAVDLTVRPGGTVEPDRVEDDLPEAAEILRAHGVGIGMITTALTEPDDPVTERVLRTASKLGITHYKLGYFRYEGFGTLRQARREAKARVGALAAMNAGLGMVGGFHNHSFRWVGASPWDVDFIIADTDPRYMGAYFDPAHATIEGGSLCWMQGMDLLADRIVMLAVKDFLWVEKPAGIGGARRFGIIIHPPAAGNTPWAEVLQGLRQVGFDGPVSIHGEYQGEHSFRDLSSEDVLAQMTADRAAIEAWDGAAEKA